MQSSKLTGLLLSVEILGDQSGTQNQHQQRNDESPLICGGIVGSCRLNEPAQAMPLPDRPQRKATRKQIP